MPDSPDLNTNLNDQLPDGAPVKRYYAFQDLCLEVLCYTYVDPDHLAWFCDAYRNEALEAALEISEILALAVPEDVLDDHLHLRYNLFAHPNAEGKPLREWLAGIRDQLINLTDDPS